MSLERLKELEDEMQKCFRCNLCKMVPLPVVKHPDYFDGCPAIREFNFHSYSGSGKQIMALSLLEGRIKADKKLAEVTNACTTCGSCDVACKFVMHAERNAVNMALREHMVEKKLEIKEHKKTIENLKKYNHPEGQQKNIAKWAKGLDLKKLPEEKADVLLYAGCLQSSDAQSANTVRKLAEILIHAGIDVGILGESEISCGLPAHWTGYRDVFTKIAEKNNNKLNQCGVKTIVAVSGSCLGTFRAKYPEYASKPEAEVLHATEFLWDLIKAGRLSLSASVNKKVTYHDPCYLGRQSEPPREWSGKTELTHGVMSFDDPPKQINYGCEGVYDAPRNILKSVKGLDFIEMYRIREYSFCCGGGGGVPDAYPEMSKSSAQHRISEALDVGAEELVTACHECRINFNKNKSKKDSIIINDIIDIVYEAANIKQGV